MIKVALVRDEQPIGGPLEFEDATGWEFTDKGTLVVLCGDVALAEVQTRYVLFVEREEYDEEEVEVEGRSWPRIF